ncbi:hypothetical protein BH23ACT10_BH23ACT10_11320 [soil metagenome]
MLTRTGRPFFDDAETSERVLDEIRTAVGRAGLWDELATDWLCLDAELLPWNARGERLIRRQFARVGAAATASLAAVNAVLADTGDRVDVADLRATYTRRANAAARFTDAYASYCWPVDSVADLRLAPFQLLAAEGDVLLHRDHAWHMAVADRLGQQSELLVGTPNVELDPTDDRARADAVAWWESLTAGGGEGMVVKPLTTVTTDRRGRIVQPGVKCRGRDYLRIIYGIDYDAPEALAMLRARNLRHKRAMAIREFALGVEALTRFVQREPLHRVHEAVFGVLAIESEPVDPRLRPGPQVAPGTARPLARACVASLSSKVAIPRAPWCTAVSSTTTSGSRSPVVARSEAHLTGASSSTSVISNAALSATTASSSTASFAGATRHSARVTGCSRTCSVPSASLTVTAAG